MLVNKRKVKSIQSYCRRSGSEIPYIATEENSLQFMNSWRRRHEKWIFQANRKTFEDKNHCETNSKSKTRNGQKSEMKGELFKLGKKWKKKAKVFQKWGISYRIPKREQIQMKISHWWKAWKQPRKWKWHKEVKKSQRKSKWNGRYAKKESYSCYWRPWGRKNSKIEYFKLQPKHSYQKQGENSISESTLWGLCRYLGKTDQFWYIF